MRRHAKGLFAIAATAAFFALSGQAFAVAPTVTIDSGPTASFTRIVGTGTVDPGDQDVGLYVEYATDPGGPWSEAFVQPIAPGAGPTPVTYELSGLTPGTQYYVRLDAWTGDYNLSSAITATTLAAPDAPSVRIDQPSAVTSTSVHFSGEVETATGSNPGDATWRFQCLPECPGLSGGLVTAGNSATVEADATGLVPNTTYLVSLIAENPGGQAIAGPESFTTPIAAPQVAATSARPMRTEVAMVGRINPGGGATTYRFEYGLTSSYGQGTAAKPVDAGTGMVAVATTVAGLAQETTYHYRLVASNSVGTAEGPDQTFTTWPAAEAADSCPNAAIRAEQGAQALPDCRAWEKVSPDDKNNSDIAEETGTVVSSSDGNGVSFASKAAFAHAQGASISTSYLARREGGRWVAAGITPPIGAETFGIFNKRLLGPFSPDLSRVLLRNQWSPTLTSDAQSEVVTPYVRDNLTGGYVNVAPSDNPLPTGPLSSAAVYAGASDDFSHVLLGSSNELVTGVPAGTYAYEFAEGSLRVASIVGGSPVEAMAGTRDNTAADRNLVPGTRSVSRDGSEAVFVTLADQQVYVRVNGRETLHASASQRTDCADHDPCSGVPEPDPDGVQPGKFLTMSGNGDAVLFESPERLTNDASLPGGRNLYLFEPKTGELHNLTGDSPTTPAFKEVFAVSEDGRTVYFSSVGVLVPGAPSEALNLYVWHDGVVRLVASRIADGPADQARGGSFRTAVTNPAGTALAFTSAVPLKGEDFQPTSVGACGSYLGCREVYVYDRRLETLNCVSCGWPASPPDRPVGSAGFTMATYGVVELDDFVVGALSDDGSRVFFDSPDALVPADTNGRYDVYEWESPGTNGCVSTTPAFQQAAEGCIFLLSNGTGEADSRFLDAAPDGDNVFFVSGSRLVGSDRDGNLDLYDARVDGGLPSQAGNAAPPGCSGEQCQPLSGAVPIATQPATSQVHQGQINSKKRPRQRKRCHGIRAKGSKRVARKGSGKCRPRGSRSKAGRNK